MKTPARQKKENDSGDEQEELKCKVTRRFLRLAREYYKLDPQRLANAILFGFVCNPPRNLIIVSSKPERRRK